jgi:hypothetical protein
MDLDELRVRLREAGPALKADAIDWCRDRSWEVRVPVFLAFAWVLVHHLKDHEYQNFFLGGIVLGTHEAGHVLFKLFGNAYLTTLAGTLVQWLAPLVVAGVFWRTQRDYFAVAFCLGWFAASAYSSATYVSDARGQYNLPLVSPWGSGTSVEMGGGDWRHILEPLGLLTWDQTTSKLFKLIGLLSFGASFALGGWLCWTMHRLRSEPPPPPPVWATRQPPPRPPYVP